MTHVNGFASYSPKLASVKATDEFVWLIFGFLVCHMKTPENGEQ